MRDPVLGGMIAGMKNLEVDDSQRRAGLRQGNLTAVHLEVNVGDDP